MINDRTIPRRFPLATLVLALALPSLAACGEATDAGAEPMPDQMTEVAPVIPDLPEPRAETDAVGDMDAACRANLASPFVGLTLDLETRTALLEAVAPQATIRFITPEDEIEATEDEVDTDADRLNVRTNADEEIIEVFCG